MESSLYKEIRNNRASFIQESIIEHDDAIAQIVPDIIKLIRYYSRHGHTSCTLKMPNVWPKNPYSKSPNIYKFVKWLRKQSELKGFVIKRDYKPDRYVRISWKDVSKFESNDLPDFPK